MFNLRRNSYYSLLTLPLALGATLTLQGCVDDSPPEEMTTDDDGAVMADDDTALVADDTAGGAAADDTAAATGDMNNCGGEVLGGGETPSANCTNTAPPNCNISDFGDGYLTNGDWNDGESLSGETFTYTGEGSEVMTSKGAGYLSVTGAVLNYAGWGFSFGPCVDASAFDGIQFQIQGDLGEGGELVVQVQSNENYPITIDEQDETKSKGGCDFGEETMWSACGSSSFVANGVTVEENNTFYIPWAEFTGGKPVATLSANQLRGVQFQLNCGEDDTTCNVDLQLHDLRFYRGHAPFLGPEPVATDDAAE